ncbi:lipase family protein, partial [Xanthobacter agilis]
MPAKISTVALAKLSASVYSGRRIELPFGYSKNEKFTFSKDGMTVTAFSSWRDNNTIFVFTGTDVNGASARDQLRDDAKIFLGRDDAQSLLNAKYYGIEAKSALDGGGSVILIGHSLGGAHAAVAASALNEFLLDSGAVASKLDLGSRVSAVAFDAPFMNSSYFDGQKYFNIYNIVSSADPVSAVTAALGYSFPGEVNYVATGADPRYIAEKIQAATSYANYGTFNNFAYSLAASDYSLAASEALKGHGIDSMVSALEAMNASFGRPIEPGEIHLTGDDVTLYDLISTEPAARTSVDVLRLVAAAILHAGFGNGVVGQSELEGYMYYNYFDRFANGYSFNAVYNYVDAILSGTNAVELTFTSSWGGDVTSSIDWSSPNVESYISPDAVNSALGYGSFSDLSNISSTGPNLGGYVPGYAAPSGGGSSLGGGGMSGWGNFEYGSGGGFSMSGGVSFSFP